MLPEDIPSQVIYRVQLPGNTSLRATRQAASALQKRIESAQISSGQIQIEGGYTDQTNLANLANEGLNRFTITVPVEAYQEVGRLAGKIGRASCRERWGRGWV